jgi:peptide/nickel transport system substrate-binding protein
MARGYWAAIQSQRSSRRRLLKAFGIGSAGAAAIALVGCGGSSNGGSASSSSSASADETGPLAPSQVLKVRYYADPQGFDPATLFQYHVENIAFNIYSGLTTYDSSTGKIISDLAESWERPDPTTINFKLVHNAKFHKGFGDFTAEDVRYSYKRILDPGTGSSYTAELNNIDSIAAPDPYTVTIKLKGPDVNFLRQIASYHQGQIVNRKAIEKYGPDYKFRPIGTGPFTFDSFAPSQQMVLSRHPDYFREPATLEKIIFSIIKDDATAAIALQNGEVDLAMMLSMDAPLRQIMASDKFAMHTVEASSVGVTIFNTENQYLKDPRVRYAYAHSIDEPTVLQTVSPLTGKVWNNIIPGWMDVYTPDVPEYPYDPAKAKAYLSAAGFTSGGSH